MSGNTYWVISLAIGLAAALIVTTLLVMLLRSVASIERSVGGLLSIAGNVAGNTANIPQLEATAPVLAQIVDEAVVQDAANKAGGLGLFIRSLVGLDRQAANEAFEKYLDETRFSVQQVRFVGLIIDELTRNGVVEPGRLFESPYTDIAATGPDLVFPDEDVQVIVDTLDHIKQTALPSEVA